MFEITVDEIYQINETKYHTRYQPIETLARGAFGLVIKALDNNTNSEVAVKIIPKANESESSLKQYKEEVKALTKINHSNIVQLFEFFETKDNMYFVMEYLKGGTLHELMKKRDFVFSEDESRIIIKNVLRAVEHLHKLNICHRDIKPDNIMFVNDNDLSSIKLIDFGLSTQSCENSQLFCGTFLYMAPERLLKQNYCEKIDIWSIGIVAHMLLEGNKHPFYSNKETKEFYTQKFLDYSTQNKLSSLGCSLICKNFLKKLLEIKPSARYPASFALQHPWITQEKSVLRKNILREEMERVNTKLKQAFLSMVALAQLTKASKENAINLENNTDRDKNVKRTKTIEQSKGKENNEFHSIRKSFTKDDISKFANKNSTKRSRILLLKNKKEDIDCDSPLIQTQVKKTSHLRISSLCPSKRKTSKIFLKSDGGNKSNSTNNSNTPYSITERDPYNSTSKSKFDFNKKEAAVGTISPFQCYQSTYGNIITNTNKTTTLNNKRNSFKTPTGRILTKMTILSKFKNIENKAILTQPSETKSKNRIFLPFIKPQVTVDYIDC